MDKGQFFGGLVLHLLLWGYVCIKASSELCLELRGCPCMLESDCTMLLQLPDWVFRATPVSSFTQG